MALSKEELKKIEEEEAQQMADLFSSLPSVKAHLREGGTARYESGDRVLWITRLKRWFKWI